MNLSVIPPCEAERLSLVVECLWQIATNFAWPLLLSVTAAILFTRKNS